VLRHVQNLDPALNIVEVGTEQAVPLTINVKKASKIDVLRAIGMQTGDKADLAYSNAKNNLTVTYHTPKAIPMPPVTRLDDGTVIVQYGKARAALSCQTFDVCTIQLEAGEKINKLDIGDRDNWNVSSSIIGEAGSRSIALVVQPKSRSIRTSLMIATNKRIYSVSLRSPAVDTELSDTNLKFHYS
jgi:type IV secretion system protein VirB9